MMSPETLKLIVDVAQPLAAIAGALSALAAFYTIKKTNSARKNERLLDHAVITLERAFDALTENGNHNPPDANNLSWLTAARLLEEYKETKSQLRDKLTKRECDSHEEHWRHQFYLALLPISRGNGDYFRVGKITKSAALVVHRFADWPDLKVDPLSKYDDPNSGAKLVIHKRWSALAHYVAAFY